jgi:hypothetical protein
MCRLGNMIAFNVSIKVMIAICDSVVMLVTRVGTARFFEGVLDLPTSILFKAIFLKLHSRLCCIN